MTKYKKAHLEALMIRILHLFTPGRVSSDPILGYPSNEAAVRASFQRKHGNLIEEVISRSINMCGDWEVRPQTTFSFCSEGLRPDRFALNRNLGLIIILECKRDLRQQDSDSLRKIRRYFCWAKKHSTDIARHFRMPPESTLVVFSVFDAYGNGERRTALPGIPVITPSELSDVFGDTVSNEFDELDRKVRLEAKKVDRANEVQKIEVEAEYAKAQPTNSSHQRQSLKSILKALRRVTSTGK
jgi:hypothetical protein